MLYTYLNNLTLLDWRSQGSIDMAAKPRVNRGGTFVACCYYLFAAEFVQFSSDFVVKCLFLYDVCYCGFAFQFAG